MEKIIGLEDLPLLKDLPASAGLMDALTKSHKESLSLVLEDDRNKVNKIAYNAIKKANYYEVAIKYLLEENKKLRHDNTKNTEPKDQVRVN